MVIRRTGDKLLLSKYVFFFIMLIPDFLGYRSDLRVLYNGWHMIQLAITLCALLLYVGKYRFNNITVNCVLIYYVIVAISCYYNGYSINMIKWDIASDVGIVIIAYLLIKQNYGHFLSALSSILFAYLMINTATMLVFTNGIASGRIGQTVWFLGGKNTVLPWILIGGGALY